MSATPWKQLHEREVLGWIEHAVLDTSRDEATVLGMGHRIGARHTLVLLG